MFTGQWYILIVETEIECHKFFRKFKSEKSYWEGKEGQLIDMKKNKWKQ